MNIALTLLMIAVAGRALCLRYQRTHIALLGQHLAGFQLERHMETLTQGYTRANHEEAETRRIQVLETFAQTERTVAAQAQSLADAMQKKRLQAARMGSTSFCLPYAEPFMPNPQRAYPKPLTPQ